MPVKRKHLTRQEVGQILLAADRGIHFERDYCLIQMCFLHGLRVSELCGMRLSDIDLVGRSVYIRRLKNSLSTQHPLFDAELPALMRWLKVRRRWREADSDWLFCRRKGVHCRAIRSGYCSDVTANWVGSAFPRIRIC